TTAVLAGLLMLLSLLLAMLYKGGVTGAGHDILAQPPAETAPVATTAPPAVQTKAPPAAPKP
ncbi:MAG: preprotein translocase subunit SecG, partial [Acetobacter sp.]